MCAQLAPPEPGSTPTMRIAVVGSVNVDLVLETPRLPAPGETLLASSMRTGPGGKGANQAVAARRLGAEVSMLGRVGSDSYADVALRGLREAGVDVSSVRPTPHTPTGLAVVQLDTAGENTIVVHPGANALLRPGDLPDVLAFDAVVCQLEVPLDTVAEAARRCTGLFCLNAAPAARLPVDLLPRVDVVVVNEAEYALLSGELADCRALVVRTRGAQGAELVRGGAVQAAVAAPAVDAVDTVGAGDTFVAALVVALLAGRSEQDAVAWACAAGALSTTGRGAQAAMPGAAAVDALADNHRGEHLSG